METPNKSAVITGAGRRLGLFVTKKLLDEGWIVHALTRKLTTDLAALDCERLHVHELGDYTEEGVINSVRGIQEKQASLPIHLLLHNASIFENDVQVEKNGLRRYDAMIFVHMTMPALLTKGLMSSLSNEESPGNVISITDIYSENPNPDYTLYCSTKAGLQNLTDGFAKKYAPFIRANSIQPGPIKFLPEHNNSHQKQVLSETLLPFEGGFLPIYQTIEFILNNHYLTGGSIKVDGGRSLVRG